MPLSVLISLVLSVLPLLDIVELLRPWYLSLVVLYWVIYHPRKISYWLVFALGLVEDMLMGTVLGHHSLLLVVLLLVGLKIRRIVKVFPLWQQSFSVGIILFVVHLGDFALTWFFYHEPQFITFILRSLVSAICWMVLVLLMQHIIKVGN